MGTINQSHGGDLQPGGGLCPKEGPCATGPQTLPSTLDGQCARSSGVYRRVYDAVAWVVLGEHPILRALFWAAITIALWLNRLGLVCVLLALGQFRIAFWTDRRRPTDGAFSKEVN